MLNYKNETKSRVDKIYSMNWHWASISLQAPRKPSISIRLNIVSSKRPEVILQPPLVPLLPNPVELASVMIAEVVGWPIMYFAVLAGECMVDVAAAVPERVVDEGFQPGISWEYLGDDGNTLHVGLENWAESSVPLELEPPPVVSVANAWFEVTGDICDDVCVAVGAPIV